MKMPFFAKKSPALWAGVVLSCPIWALAQTAPALTAPAAPLYEQAKVLSSTPVVKQVQMQQRFCNNQPVEVSAPNTGAGAVIGALVGGAVGSAVGQGSGNAAATALGAVGGAILGNQAEGQGTRVQNAVTCTVQNTTQNVTVFQVVYEWGGKPYTVEMPRDPGPSITVQVAPVIANAVAPAVAQAGGVTPSVLPGDAIAVPGSTTTTTVVVPSVYPYPYRYVVPAAAGLYWGYAWRPRHRWGHHWR